MNGINGNQSKSADTTEAKRVAFHQANDSLDLSAAANKSSKAADASAKMHSASMRRSESYGHMTAGSEAHVLVIYTGGTIGMMRNENNGLLQNLSFSFW